MKGFLKFHDHTNSIFLLKKNMLVKAEEYSSCLKQVKTRLTLEDGTYEYVLEDISTIEKMLEQVD